MVQPAGLVDGASGRPSAQPPEKVAVNDPIDPRRIIGQLDQEIIYIEHSEVDITEEVLSDSTDRSWNRSDLPQKKSKTEKDERSFCGKDPFGNNFCCVDRSTMFTGS